MEPITLEKAKETFFLACQCEGRSKQTLDLYHYILKSFDKFLDGRAITEVTPTDIRRYLFHLTDKGYSKSTVYTHHKNLRAFFNFLVAEGLMDKSPVDPIKSPKVPKVFPYVLSEEEVLQLLGAAKGHLFTHKRNYAMVCLMLDTGIRVGELVNLKMDDISFASMTLKVKGKGEIERTIIFSKKSAKAMTAYIGARGHQPYEDALFISQQGNALKRNSVLQIVKRLGDKAGLHDKRVCPHTLRHTFATLYIKRGGSPFVLQRLLGHSDIKTVMVYVNLVGKDLREDYFRHSPLDGIK